MAVCLNLAVKPKQVNVLREGVHIQQNTFDWPILQEVRLCECFYSINCSIQTYFI